jgi:hypothetical protein
MPTRSSGHPLDHTRPPEHVFVHMFGHTFETVKPVSAVPLAIDDLRPTRGRPSDGLAIQTPTLDSGPRRAWRLHREPRAPSVPRMRLATTSAADLSIAGSALV